MTLLDELRRWDTSSRKRVGWRTVARAAAGVALAVLAVFAILKVITAGQDSETRPPTTAVPASANPAAEESLCGLKGGRPGQPITGAPAAVWRYSGTRAYPTSQQNGPGAIAPSGFRYCFSHTTEGALFAAANAIAMPETSEGYVAWVDHFIGKGPNRDDLVAASLQGGSGTGTATRGRIVGFNVLEATDDRARIDIAVEVNGTRLINAAGVYDLLWEDGDWRYNPVAGMPDVALISDTSGYIPWGP